MISAPVHERPAISLIAEDLGPDRVALFIGGTNGARDLALLKSSGITTVINCAVNLDINYVRDPDVPGTQDMLAAGSGPVRSYKIGLIDGDGNPSRMMLAGYYILDGALNQVMPDKASYPVRNRGNVLVHCRGGRSRSVALVALFLHRQQMDRYPTLEAAIQHVRHMRELHEDEWFETPKPVLIEAVGSAARAIALLENSPEADDMAATRDPRRDSVAN